MAAVIPAEERIAVRIGPRAQLGSLWRHPVLRAFLKAALTVLVATTITFALIRLLPGNPIDLRIDELTRDGSTTYEQAREQVAALYAIDVDLPIPEQYVGYLWSVARGDLGNSFLSRTTPVTSIILTVLPWTLFAVGTGLLLSFTAGIGLGLVAAYKRGSFFDQAVTFFSYVGYSMPTFWLGLMLLLIFAVFIHAFPVAGIVDVRLTGAPFLTADYNAWFGQHPIAGILDILAHIVLPATTIAIVGIAGDSRFMRSSMLDAIHQDYVRTARAKGLSERVVVLKHALRNALLPVITNIAIELPLLFSGAVVTEAIFSWPGMGQLFFQALEAFDYPLLMGILSVSAVLIVLFNLFADIAYAYIDPRISYA